MAKENNDSQEDQSDFFSDQSEGPVSFLPVDALQNDPEYTKLTAWLTERAEYLHWLGTEDKFTMTSVSRWPLAKRLGFFAKWTLQGILSSQELQEWQELQAKHASIVREMIRFWANWATESDHSSESS